MQLYRPLHPGQAITAIQLQVPDYVSTRFCTQVTRGPALKLGVGLIRHYLTILIHLAEHFSSCQLGQVYVRGIVSMHLLPDKVAPSQL